VSKPRISFSEVEKLLILLRAIGELLELSTAKIDAIVARTKSELM